MQQTKLNIDCIFEELSWKWSISENGDIYKWLIYFRNYAPAVRLTADHKVW